MPNQFIIGFLPNGTRLNDFANFYTESAPTRRNDGTTLKVGDVWYKPSVNKWGQWNGTYWLGDNYRTTIYRAATGTGNTDNLAPSIPFGSLFIESVSWKYAANGTNDNSNFVTFQAGYFEMNSASNLVLLGTQRDSKTATVAGTKIEIVETINTAITNNEIRGFRLVATLTGSSNYRLYCDISIKEILT